MRGCISFVLAATLSVIPQLVCGSEAVAQDFARTSVPHKWIEPLVPEDLPPLDLPEYVATDPLEKARAESFAGRYRLSLLTLRTVKRGSAADIALVRAASLDAIGKKTQAMNALAAGAVADDPRVQIATARLLAEIGQPRDGIALLQLHLKQHPDSIAGHYYLGQLCEEVGDMAQARKAYAFFEPFVDKWLGGGAKAFENAEEVTLIGRGIDRWASINSLYQTHDSLHQTILNIFTKAYDVIDRGYWPAHVAAAEYLLSHDDPEEALKELQRAQAGNPRDIGTLVLFGQILLRQYNFDGIDQVVAAIRQVDPDAIPAELMFARNLLQQQRPKDAESPIRRVLARQPENIEALGLMAAAYALQLDVAKMHDALEQVDRIDPHNARAYLEVAEQLAAMRQYPRSAAMYKIAIERAPWWTSARNGLGLLYTQSGDEDLAQTVLEAAHTLDPFNKATTNYLRLLDELFKFDRKETAHFIVMYDAKKDPMIPEYFGDYLESIYTKVCGEYRTEPPVKTYIEVFPTHASFSVRTTGSPWIGTVGASTGRVIAMVAPRKGDNTLGSFNWSQVLRHEFTHTVTLAATDNRISHWMTEGLAVYEEHVPLRWEWVPMLYHAVTQHEFFTMDNLTWGFVRPKRPIDRQLAYAESFWICTYIEQTYGHEAILKMLAEFKKGKSQDEVFPLVLNCSMSSFQEGFFAWADKQVSSWGYDKESTAKYAALLKKGNQQILSHQYKAAIDTWKEIAALRPVDALPHTRLAGLYLTHDVNQPELAAEHLIALDKVELSDNRYAKRLARLFRDMNRPDQAAQYALQAVYIDPYDMEAHELLADIDQKTGDAAGLAREQRVMPVLAKWIEENRKASEPTDPPQ